MKAPRGAIRITDSEGQLQIAGYEWHERSNKPFVFGVGVLLFAGLGIVALLLAMKSEVFIATIVVLAIAACFFGLSWIIHRRWSRWNGNVRSILFHANGHVEIPHGIPYHPKVRTFTVPWSEIASVSADQNSVVIYFRNGERNWITDRPADESSHKISVQIQHALAAIGEAVANATRPKRAPSPEGNVLID